MENVSKALLLSASVLLAIFIVAMGVRLFSSASRVTKAYDSSMSQVQIASFNTNFTKVMGSTATFAYDYNSRQVIDPRSTESLNDTGLVRVDLKSKSGATIEHLQVKEKIYDILLQECYYQDNNYPNAKSIITYEITVNAETTGGLIRWVTFTPMTDGVHDEVPKAIIKANDKLSTP